MSQIRYQDLREGEALPPLTVAVTPSVIVAGALASGDFRSCTTTSPRRARAARPTFS